MLKFSISRRMVRYFHHKIINKGLFLSPNLKYKVNFGELNTEIVNLCTHIVPGSISGPRTRNGTLTSNSKGNDLPFTRPN
jgi:hypothetical protein